MTKNLKFSFFSYFRKNQQVPIEKNQLHCTFQKFSEIFSLSLFKAVNLFYHQTLGRSVLSNQHTLPE